VVAEVAIAAAGLGVAVVGELMVKAGGALPLINALDHPAAAARAMRRRAEARVRGSHAPSPVSGLLSHCNDMYVSCTIQPYPRPSRMPGAVAPLVHGQSPLAAQVRFDLSMSMV
jgi:hypothetical protein